MCGRAQEVCAQRISPSDGDGRVVAQGGEGQPRAVECEQPTLGHFEDLDGFGNANFAESSSVIPSRPSSRRGVILRLDPESS